MGEVVDADVGGADVDEVVDADVTGAVVVGPEVGAVDAGGGVVSGAC
jgi:hypothetical protein